MRPVGSVVVLASSSIRVHVCCSAGFGSAGFAVAGELSNGARNSWHSAKAIAKSHCLSASE